MGVEAGWKVSAGILLRFVSGFSNRNSEPGSIRTNRVGFHLRHSARRFRRSRRWRERNGEKRCDFRERTVQAGDNGQFIIPGLSPGRMK